MLYYVNLAITYLVLCELYLLASHHFTDTVLGAVSNSRYLSRSYTGIFPLIMNVIIDGVPPVALSALKAVFNLY